MVKLTITARLINKIFIRFGLSNFKVDERIDNIYLFHLILNRLLMLLRGYLIKWRMKGTKKLFFCGKNVRLMKADSITIGNFVTIHDNVIIDALSEAGVILGNNVTIGENTQIRCTGSLSHIGKGVIIGNNSSMGAYCFLGAAGGIKIGDNVLMGQWVRFHSENHNFDRIDVLIKEQGVTNKGIVIGDNCWIGAGAVFLDGVKVGEGSVIGANTLVNKDVPPYSVAVGNPVRVIKSRQ